MDSTTASMPTILPSSYWKVTALRVRTHTAGAVFAHWTALHQTVRVGHRGGISTSVRGGVAKHRPDRRALLERIGTVNALIDIRGLLADGAQYCAGVGVKAHVRMNVADFAHGLAGDLFDIDPGAGGDFTADQHMPVSRRFRRRRAPSDLVPDGVEDGIGDLIGDFIRIILETDSDRCLAIVFFTLHKTG